MAEIDSEYVAWKSSLLTIMLVAAFIFATILNSLLIFVFVRSKKLRKAPNLFLVNLAVVDLFAAVCWLIPAIVASARWNWPFGGALCRLHGFAGTFTFSMNMFTLTVIAFEKFLKIMSPRKHSDAFYNKTITMVVVVSLWLLATVVAFMPLIGWGVFKFFNYQLQCVTDFVESVSHLNFFFVNAFCFPVIAMLALYTATLIRIRLLQKRGATKDGKIVMQSDDALPPESFAQKMRRMQDNFKFVVDAGGADNELVSDDDDSVADVSDDNEMFSDYVDYQRKKRERESARRRRKVFAFRRQYLFMSLTMIAVSLVCVTLWLPFFIVTYTWVHEPDDVSESSYTFVSLLPFFSVCYKPLVYVFNKHIRLCVRQAFTRSKKKPNKVILPDHVAKYRTEGGDTGPEGDKSPADDEIRTKTRQANDVTVDDMQDIDL